MSRITPTADPPTPGGRENRHGLLERAPELARLDSAIARAGEGSGGLLLIEGEAGIGKTALLEAAREIASRRRMRVLAARATEIEREFPYGAIRQLLEPALRSATPEERRRWLAGSAAPAALVLAPKGNDPPVEAGAATLNGLYWLIDGLADERPCLILLDDAQWVDPDSLRFLAFLAPRLAELPVLAIIAARSEGWERVAELAGTASDPASRPIVLTPLSPQACAVVVDASLGGTAGTKFASACHQATGGNPFYLHALLDELRRDGVDPTDAATERVLGLGPRAVGRAVVARMARLAPSAVSLARAGSVLGDGAPLAQAARLAGIESSEAATAAGQLAAASILAAESPLRFAHPIIGNAVYSDIERGERAGLHRRAVALLREQARPVERIAAHLRAIDPSGDQAAVGALRAAATDALARGAPASAAAHLRRALAEPPEAAERGAVLLELGTAELAVEGSPAVEHLNRARVLAESPAQRVAVARVLVMAFFSVGETEPAVEMLRSELELIDGEPALARTLEIDLVLALSMAMEEGLLAEAQERIERLAPELSGATPDERRALGCLAYCRLCSGAPVAEVVRPARMRLELIPDTDRMVQTEPDWLFAVGTLAICGEFDLAERWAARGLADAKAAGLVYGLAAAHWALGTVAWVRGRLADAASSYESALRAAREYGAVVGVHASLYALVEAQTARGEFDAAEAVLAEFGLEFEMPGAVPTRGELLEARARLRLAQGDAEAALRDLAGAAAYARERADLAPGMTTWRSTSALAHLRLGERDRARRLADEELARARHFGAPRTLGIALQAAALAAGGERGLALLREADELLADSPYRLEHARSLVELGAALRRNGEREAAREPLKQGLETARSCGAVPLVEHAYEELRATGARPRKILYTGVESLTPSEGRVARLAASGMTNRQIAGELFVTTKTVEFHLGSAYRKLEIGSRAELRTALDDTNAPTR